MTRYYERRAQELEAQAAESRDPAEQVRLWGEASLIGTPVEYCPMGDELPYPGAPTCGDCDEPEWCGAGTGQAAGAEGPSPSTDPSLTTERSEVPFSWFGR